MSEFSKCATYTEWVQEMQHEGGSSIDVIKMVYELKDLIEKLEAKVDRNEVRRRSLYEEAWY